ncbi:MAG: Rab family GTPase [Promethearchaeota archaeon]
MEAKGSQFMFKVSLIGDYAVGKTSIIKRYLTNSFDEGYKATLGAAISSFKTSVADSLVSLQVWDLAGQTSFRRVRVQYLFGTDFAIVVYDVTRKDTLDCVKEWVDDVKQGAPEVLLFLVGNKVDLTDSRVVNRAEAEKVAKNLNMLGYIETSAKDGTNVKELFQTISKLLLEHTTNPPPKKR